MTVVVRTPIYTAVSLFLNACAAGPAAPPPAVDVDADTLTPEYSSFNTRIVSDSARVEHAFTASLDGDREPVTRLESAFTQTLGADGDRLRIGDTVSSVGMWGSAVRYGGLQFGAGSQTRDDVISSPRLATAGLAVLPTVADALFASADDSGTDLDARNLSVKRSLRGTGGAGPWSLTAEDALGRRSQARAGRGRPGSSRRSP